MLRFERALCLLLLAACDAVSERQPAVDGDFVTQRPRMRSARATAVPTPPPPPRPPPLFPTGPFDAGPTTWGADAAADAGASAVCDPARCPVSSAVLRFDSLWSDSDEYGQKPCCIGASEHQPWDPPPELLGTCGVLFPDSYSADIAYCRPIVDGDPDDTCLDTVTDGEVVKGCRRPDGRCGHETPGWGCHTVYRYYWDWHIDDTSFTSPFNCTHYGEPCTRSSQCCAHPNYGNVCWPDDGDDVDAGDDDAGAMTGHCEYAYYVDDATTSPFPR